MNDPNANRLPIIGSDPIIDFYLGKAPDGAGRCIEEIWKFGHERLERVHDYIQWLFPLPDKSPFNRDAPVLTPKTIRAFRESVIRFCIYRTGKTFLTRRLRLPESNGAWMKQRSA